MFNDDKLKDLIKEGYRVYFCKDVLLKTNEDLIKIINNEEYSTIEVIFNYDFIADGLYGIESLINDSFIVDLDGEIVSPNVLKDIIIDIFPNALTISDKVLKEYIEEDMQYVFSPMYEMTRDEVLFSKHKYNVKDIGVMGLVGSGGFLDLQDTIHSCYFIRNGEVVDLSELKALYKNWWKRKKNL